MRTFRRSCVRPQVSTHLWSMMAGGKNFPLCQILRRWKSNEPNFTRGAFQTIEVGHRWRCTCAAISFLEVAVTMKGTEICNVSLNLVR